MKKIQIILMFVFSVLFSNALEAQHHRHAAHRRAHKHHRVVKRSRYRPAVAVVYHPHWAPHRNIHRRWVYFPAHRLYWDNWRQVYYYHNGRKWMAVSTPPPHLKNVNLDNEKFEELSEDVDDDDEIYLQEK